MKVQMCFSGPVSAPCWGFSCFLRSCCKKKKKLQKVCLLLRKLSRNEAVIKNLAQICICIYMFVCCTQSLISLQTRAWLIYHHFLLFFDNETKCYWRQQWFWVFIIPSDETDADCQNKIVKLIRLILMHATSCFYQLSVISSKMGLMGMSF